MKVNISRKVFRKVTGVDSAAWHQLRIARDTRKGKAPMKLILNLYAGEEFHSREYCNSVKEGFHKGYGFILDNPFRAFHLFPENTTSGMFVGRESDLNQETMGRILEIMEEKLKTCK